MRVSVIIPNYNHAAFLKQRIDSVLNQTFQDFEIIILDDCSSDNSKEIIEEYRKIPQISHIVYNQKNSGSPFKQWKKGIQLAKGEFIWIAESDDWASENFLNTLIYQIQQNNAVIAYCRTMSVIGEDRKIFSWGETLQPDLWCSDHVFTSQTFINSFLLFRNIIPNASAVLFKRECFINMDQIVKMRFAGDWLCWIKIAAKGNISYTSQPLNYFRRHDNSTQNLKSFAEELVRVKEYFMSINTACAITNTRFQASHISYEWIIEQWILRTKIFNSVKVLFPPYPFLFLIRFLKRLLKR